MQLNTGQTEAVEKIVNFIKAPSKEKEEYFYTLSGFAGTGKSTIMNIILKRIPSNYKVAVSAPTHTAKEIISAFTKRPAETIQALLGLRPNTDLEDFDPNKPQFAVMVQEKIQYYNVLVIDEASMLGKDLVKLIEETAYKYRVKVIYMGDMYQLPPIGEKISVVFENKNVSHLTEIVRQSGENPNTQLIELSRNDVRDSTTTCTKFLKSFPCNTALSGEEFKTLTQNPFYTLLLEKYFDSEYKSNPLFIKTLAWRNETVKKINLYIRHHLVKSTELVAKGDVLVGYKTIVVAEGGNFTEIVRNSCNYTVEDVTIEQEQAFGYEWKFYLTSLKETSVMMKILHRDSYPDFIKAYKEYLHKAKQYGAWKPFYKFKESFVIMEDLLIEPGTICSKDIDYGYAITVHKAQGSTYVNTAVILQDILANRNKLESKKLLYVALSRTSKSNYIYG